MNRAARPKPSLSRTGPLLPLAFGASFLLLSLILLFFRPYFETNDDAFKALLAQGIAITPAPCEYLLISNILLGKTLKLLYALAPHLPWWGLILYLGLFLALSCFFYALWSEGPGPFRPILFLLVLLGVGLPFLFLLQFTCVAILAGGGALFLLRSLLRRPSPPRTGFLLSGLTLWTSFLLRPEAFFLVLVFFLPLLLLENKGRRPPLPWPQLRGILLPFLLLTLLSGVLDHFAYSRDPGWGPFLSFNNVRTRLLDHNKLEVDERTLPLLKEVGWTPNDLELFKNWYFLDPKRYSTENLGRLDRGFRKGSPIHFDPWTLWHNLPPRALGVLALFFLLTIPQVPRERRWFPLVSLGWGLGLVLGMAFFVKLSNWVVFPLLFLCLFATVTESAPEDDPRGAIGFPAILVALTLWLLVQYHSADSSLQQRERALQADLARLSPSPSQLYVAWGSSFPFEAWGAFRDPGPLRDMNFFPLAVFQRSPAGQAMLDKFKVKDLLGELAQREDLLLICRKGQGILYGEHMKEVRGWDIRAQKVFEGATFQVYRVRELPASRKRP